MVKKLFLQDIEQECSFNDDMFCYTSRDRLITAVNSIIKKVEKQRDKELKIKNNPKLAKEDKEQIENYITGRLALLTDRKTNLITLRNRIKVSGKDINIDEELKQILKDIPLRKE